MPHYDPDELERVANRPSFEQLAALSDKSLSDFSTYLIESVQRRTEGQVLEGFLLSDHLLDLNEPPLRVPGRELASSYLNSLLQGRIAAALPNSVVRIDQPRRTPWPPSKTGLVDRVTLRYGEIRTHVEIYVSGTAWLNAYEQLEERARRLR